MPAESAPLTIEDWSFLHGRLMWCYAGAVKPENRRETNRSRHLTAWHLLAGRVELQTLGKTLRAGPGEWLFCGPAPRHQAFSTGARILSLNFKLEWPSGDSLIEDALVIRSDPALTRAARPLVRFIHAHFPGVRMELGQEVCDLMAFFELQRLFSAWLAAYLKATLAAGAAPARMAGCDPRVLAALRLLDRHPWEVPFREKELARQTGLSAGHLDRLFLRDLGLTPRAHLQKRRLESAQARLADRAASIKKIGYDLGFSSPAHFSHWFHKAAGRSPRAYREAAMAQL